MAKMRPDLPCKLPNNVRKKLSLRFEEDDQLDQTMSIRPVPTRHELQKSATIDPDDHNSYYYEFPREEPTFLSPVVEKDRDRDRESDGGPKFACQVAESAGASSQSTELRSSDEKLRGELTRSSGLNYVEVSVVKPSDPVDRDDSVTVKSTPDDPGAKNKDRPKLPKKLSQAEISKSNPLSLKLSESSSTVTPASNPAEPDFSVNKKLIDDLDREEGDPASNYYCQPFVATEQPSEHSLDAFKAEIYKNRANRVCADCKASDQLPNQLLCLYLITLCDQCANVHYQFCHMSNKGFIIELDTLYSLLMNPNSRSVLFNYRDFDKSFNVDSFLALFKQVGNDMINSLVEFHEDQATKSRESLTRHAFIIEKYLNKKFINQEDGVGQEELSKRLMENVSGSSLVMTIYYLFMGANINCVQGQLSVMDMASIGKQASQINFLRLNNGLYYRELNSSMLNQEWEGHLVQIYNINQSTVNDSSKMFLWCKLKLLHAQLIQLGDDQSKKDSTSGRQPVVRTSIKYSTIIRLSLLERQNTFEIKWCHQNNNSLISNYFETSGAQQLQMWTKQFLVKFLYEFLRSEHEPQKDALALKAEEAGERDDWFDNNKAEILPMLELIDSYHLILAGYLHLSHGQVLTTHSADHQSEGSDKVFAFLLSSDPLKSYSYYRNIMVLVKPKSLLTRDSAEVKQPIYQVLDLRKLVRLKRSDDSILLEMVSRSFVFKYNGYSQNLEAWYEKLGHLTKMGFKTLEDQLLDKNNVPILVDKCCSFIELNFMDEKAFYSSDGLAHLMFKENKSELRKLQGVLVKLEKERDFELSSSEFTSTQILFVLSKFLQNAKIDAALSSRPYRTAFRTTQLKSPESIDKILNILKQQAAQTPGFYHVLKRLCLHLFLISKFTSKNQLTSIALSTLFAPFLFSTLSVSPGKHKDLDLTVERTFFVHLLDHLVQNFTNLFQVSDDFIQVQFKMIEKSIYLKNLNKSTISKFNTFSLETQTSVEPSTKFLITIFLFDKNSEQSFQANVDAKFKCKSVLEMAKKEFKLDESKYWCLFEVLDHEHLSLKNNNSMSSLDLSSTSALDISTTEDPQPTTLLERLLPVNASLLDSLSTWATFYLCVKCNHIQIDIEKSFITSTNLNMNDYNVYKAIDECEFLSNSSDKSTSPNDSPVSRRHRGSESSVESGTNRSSHRYSLAGNHFSFTNSSSAAKKWKACNISIQNAIIRIHKRTGQTATDMADSPTKVNLIDEFKIEECIVYYGFYNMSLHLASRNGTKSGNHGNHLHHHVSEPNGSQLSRRSLSKASIMSSIARLKSSSGLNQRPIDEEECLTIFSKLTKSVYCIRLGTKEKAQAWYFTLFKLAHFPDTWTYFQMDHLPALKSASKKQTTQQQDTPDSTTANQADHSTSTPPSSKSLMNLFMKATNKSKKT